MRCFKFITVLILGLLALELSDPSTPFIRERPVSSEESQWSNDSHFASRQDVQVEAQLPSSWQLLIPSGSLALQELRDSFEFATARTLSLIRHQIRQVDLKRLPPPSFRLLLPPESDSAHSA